MFALEREIDIGACFSTGDTPHIAWIASASTWKFDRLYHTDTICLMLIPTTGKDGLPRSRAQSRPASGIYSTTTMPRLQERGRRQPKGGSCRGHLALEISARTARWTNAGVPSSPDPAHPQNHKMEKCSASVLRTHTCETQL